MVEFVQVGQTFGLAVALLVVIGVALWRVAVWLRPWAEKAFAAHIEFVQTTTKTVTDMAGVQGRQEDTLQQIAQTQQQQALLLQQCVAQLEALRLSTERGNALLSRQGKLVEGGVAEVKKLSEGARPSE